MRSPLVRPAVLVLAIAGVLGSNAAASAATEPPAPPVADRGEFVAGLRTDTGVLEVFGRDGGLVRTVETGAEGALRFAGTYGSVVALLDAANGTVHVVDLAGDEVAVIDVPPGSNALQPARSAVLVLAPLDGSAPPVVVDLAGATAVDLGSLDVELPYGQPAYDLTRAFVSPDGSVVGLIDLLSPTSVLVRLGGAGSEASAVAAAGTLLGLTDESASLVDPEAGVVQYVGPDGTVTHSFALPEHVAAVSLAGGAAILFDPDGTMWGVPGDPTGAAVDLGDLGLDPLDVSVLTPVGDGEQFAAGTFDGSLLVFDSEGSQLGEISGVDATAPQLPPEADDRCLPFGFEAVTLADTEALVAVDAGPGTVGARSADGCIVAVSGPEATRIVGAAADFDTIELDAGAEVPAVGPDGSAAVVTDATGTHLVGLDGDTSVTLDTIATAFVFVG